MQTHTLKTFIAAMAAKSSQAILAIRTDGMGASSMRYMDLMVDKGTRDELYDTGIAFLTFDSDHLATQYYRLIADQFPEGGQTTLSLEMDLALLDGTTHRFEQQSGCQREDSTLETTG